MTMTMTIVMIMNIYINVENTKLLAREPNKSGLINDLLAEHYRKTKEQILPDGSMAIVIPFETRGERPEHLKGSTAAGPNMPTYDPIEDIKKNNRLPDGKKTIRIESTPPGPNLFKKLTTDKVSSLIRPDIKQCPHGFAIGMCKKQDCNRKYKK